jgi:hypothetical protein
MVKLKEVRIGKELLIKYSISQVIVLGPLIFIIYINGLLYQNIDRKMIQMLYLVMY